MVYICVIVEVGNFFHHRQYHSNCIEYKRNKKIIYFPGRNAFVNFILNCIDECCWWWKELQMEKRVIDGNKCLRLIAISSLKKNIVGSAKFIIKCYHCWVREFTRKISQRARSPVIIRLYAVKYSMSDLVKFAGVVSRRVLLVRINCNFIA